MASLPDERPAARRLDHLDGLRALAALYVVLFHAGVCFSRGPLPLWARSATRLLSFGHEAVAVFIVLSGYCLMLPAARAGDGQLAHGVRGYFARRAWRILPPYYAALLGSLALIALLPVLRPAMPTGTIWDDTNPAFTTGAVVSHLLLVHNLSPDWVFRVNGPLWSVATEWQIYFFLPFVFLPLWRRSGPLATVLVAFGLGYLPLLVAPRMAHTALPWYLGLFALGMVAAAISCAPRPLEQRLRRLPWGPIAKLLIGLCAVGGLVLARLWFRWKPITDALVGLATAALLVHCVAGEGRARIVRLLSWPPLVQVGHFSYSLYLVHLPVVALCHFALLSLPLGPVAHLALLLAVTTPASLVVAYGFHLAVERHFLKPPRRWSADRPSRPTARVA
jgi:peptidoglycan/LPS O-acetylase OafA/YrhL